MQLDPVSAENQEPNCVLQQAVDVQGVSCP